MSLGNEITDEFHLDGHGRQVMWIDPAALEQGPARFAASMQDADHPA